MSFFTPDAIKYLRGKYAKDAARALAVRSGLEAEADDTGVTMGEDACVAEFGTPDEESRPFVYDTLGSMGQ